MTSLVIIWRRWFDTVDGNTYFSAEMILDGELVGKISTIYGYGDHYIDSVLDYLEEKNLIPKREVFSNGNKERSHQWTIRTGIKIFSTLADVKNKIDL